MKIQSEFEEELERMAVNPVCEHVDEGKKGEGEILCAIIQYKKAPSCLSVKMLIWWNPRISQRTSNLLDALRTVKKKKAAGFSSISQDFGFSLTSNHVIK